MRTLHSMTFAIAMALCGTVAAQTADGTTVRISTDETDLILQVGNGGRLYQKYLGPKLLDDADALSGAWAQYGGSAAGSGWEVYSTNGNEDYFEPALSITHADGNMATYLYYQGSETTAVEGGKHTKVMLADDKYPVNVTLHYVAYEKENVIKTWTEISHNEKKPVVIWNYASAMLYQDAAEYYLTEFSGDWAKEVGMSSQPLQFGKKRGGHQVGQPCWHVHVSFLRTGHRRSRGRGPRHGDAGHAGMDRQFPLHL